MKTLGRMALHTAGLRQQMDCWTTTADGYLDYNSKRMAGTTVENRSVKLNGHRGRIYAIRRAVDLFLHVGTLVVVRTRTPIAFPELSKWAELIKLFTFK